MSRETSRWLNTNVLVGMTDQRGHAWHYRQGEQGSESNHYSGAIPVADVDRRLFAWEPIEMPLYLRVPCSANDATGMADDGTPYREVSIPDRKAIVPSDDPGHVFGIFKGGYVAHDFSDWLVGGVSTILGDTLVISSAGLLSGRAVAWVEVSMPETITTPEGIAFRPNLLATTSLDGSIATTYTRTVTLTVCDNTLAAALGEQGQKYKVRHSKYSQLKMEDARQALAMVHMMADDVSAALADMCETTVTDAQWGKIVELLTDPTEGGSKSASKSGTTRSANKSNELWGLWRNDNRVSPWANTAFGVVQAVNTWEHHIKPTRGDTNRADRNALGVVKGTFAASDTLVLSALNKVMSNV